MKNKLFTKLIAGLTACMLGALTAFSSGAAPVQAATRAQVFYKMHVQNIGWMSPQHDGATAGTTGQSLRAEAFQMDLGIEGYSGGITYRGHCEQVGWTDWKTNRQTAGTEGRSLRLEAFEAKLTGDIANHFDLVYRAHCQDLGWTNWVKNGQTAGTTGQSRRLEAMQVKLVPKASGYDQKVQGLTKDSRFRNGAAWAASKTPVLSTYGSSGCCAYCADFVKYVYGKQLNASSRYTSASSIKSGDVIHFSGGQHWVVVLYRNGSQLTTAEGNWGSKVVISSSAYTLNGGSVYRNGSRFRTFVEGYHYQ
jgi:uncharacterized protein YjdB